MATLLVDVFGPGAAKGIAGIVQNFDFSKMDVKDNTRDDYLHTGLAPSYGTLTKDSIKQMDDSLKIMITGTMKALEKIPPAERSWDMVLSTMMQNSLIEPIPGDGNKVSRVDRVIKEGINVFKVDGSPDQAIVKEVEGWFMNLISDDDVLKSTKIDIHVLADIVAQTGASIDSFASLIHDLEQHDKTMVDIGVLRFPDPSRPYFQVYRIKISAWSKSERVIMVQVDKNGISGEFNSRKFQPRKEIIDNIKEDVKKKAVKEAEDLLG